MRQRCYYKKSHSYPNYGGRGIRVCEDWRENYISFYNWAISNGAAEDLSLDRIDTNGDYCPENCRWVSYSEQARNKRCNRYIEYDGKNQLLIDWAKEVGIPYDNIRARLDEYGWSIGEALGFKKHDQQKRDYSSRRKTVLQYSIKGELIKEWPSIMDIETELGYSGSSIRSVCVGESFTSHGFKWEFKDKTPPPDGIIRRRAHVKQYTTDGVFLAEYSSVAEASKSTNINGNGIRLCCTKENKKSCGGFLWKYANDTRQIEPINYIEPQTSKIITYCGESKTISEWAKQVNIRAQVIISRLNRGSSVGQALGIDFKSRKGSSYSCPIMQLDANKKLIREWKSLHYIRKEGVRDKKQVRRSIDTGLPDSHGEYWVLKDNYYAD
jgi:hypothetical protein